MSRTCLVDRRRTSDCPVILPCENSGIGDQFRSMKPLAMAGCLLALLGLIAGCSTPGTPTPTASAQAPSTHGKASPAVPLPSIREFDLPTIERLGREIYRQDQLAWVATDVVLASVSQESLRANGACGWIVDTTGGEPLVRFLRKNAGGVEASYDVRFPIVGKPAMETPVDHRLSAYQLTLFNALATAQERLIKDHCPLCTGRYNSVVLDDPAGPGLLVYLLHAETASNLVPVGGHYRISVSADGSTATRIDRLSVTCLTMDKTAGVPKGSTWCRTLRWRHMSFSRCRSTCPSPS
jgi:hypothetical protein